MTTVIGTISRWPAVMGRQLSEAAQWARGRRDVRPGTTAIAYGSSATTFLWVITAMTVVETAIVELAVPWAWLRITLAVVCIGSLPLMAGTVAGLRLYPHLLGERTLVLRHGRDWEIEIPLSLIASVGATLGTPPPRPGVVGRALELGIGTTDVVLTLRVAQEIDGPTPRTTTSIDRIRCSADDPVAFVRLVEQARTRAEGTNPTAIAAPAATERDPVDVDADQSLRR